MGGVSALVIGEEIRKRHVIAVLIEKR